MQSTVLLLGLFAGATVAVPVEQLPLSAPVQPLPDTIFRNPQPEINTAAGLHGRFLHVTGKFILSVTGRVAFPNI